MSDNLNTLGKVALRRSLQPRKRKKREPPTHVCPVCGKKRSSLRIVEYAIKREKYKKIMCIYCKKNKKYLEDK